MYQGIVLIGPPGAGKGGQAELLARDPRYFGLSSGEMFRLLMTDPAVANSEVGKKIRRIDGGNLVPDDLTMRLTRETIGRYVAAGQFDPAHQYLLQDGFPRTEAQVPLVGEFIDVQQVLHLYVQDEDELVRRVLMRAQESEKPRPDDNEKTMRERIETYHQVTEPLIALYDPSIVTRIDAFVPEAETAQEGIDAVHAMVLEHILR